jgi:hypothetical protein
MLDKAPRWVTRLSASGNTYQVLEKPLPRVDDEILQTIVYLYPSEADAHAGSKLGGTGFLIGIPVPFQQPAPMIILCIVTNRHVVDGGGTTVRMNQEAGGFEIADLDEAQWIYHPDGDDICMCPIRIGAKVKQKYLGMGQIASKALATQYDIGIGDDVFFVGRFVGLDGKQQNRPSIRFGSIAQMPDEPVLQQDGTGQESIIVEARSIPGFSGSPVFFYMMPEPQLHIAPEYIDSVRESRFFNKTRLPSGIQIGPWVIGVDYCNIYDKYHVKSERTQYRMHDWYVEANAGMMGVVPSWKIWDIVDSVEMKKIRDDAEADLNRRIKESPVKLNDASGGARSNDENPTHLEDFRTLLTAASKTPPRGD